MDIEQTQNIIPKTKSKILFDWYDYLYEYGFTQLKNQRIYRITNNLEVGFWIKKQNKTHYTPIFCVKPIDDVSFLYNEPICDPICLLHHKQNYIKHLETYHMRYSVLHVKNEEDCYKLLVHMVYNNPKLKKEQSDYLIDHIKEYCRHPVVLKKLKYFAVQKMIFQVNKKYQKFSNSLQIRV